MITLTNSIKEKIDNFFDNVDVDNLISELENKYGDIFFDYDFNHKNTYDKLERNNVSELNNDTFNDNEYREDSSYKTAA